MKKIILISMALSLIISMFAYFANQDKPLINLTSYDSFYNLYHYEDEVKLMMGKDDQEIAYILDVSASYKVSILNQDYQDTENHLVVLNSENENSYIELEIYDESLVKVATYEFYYTKDLDQLTYINWVTFEPIKGAAILFVIVFSIQLVALGIYFLVKKFDHHHEPKSNRLLDLFKASSITKKITFILIMIFLIIFTQGLGFILVVFFLYQIYEHATSISGGMLSYLIFFVLFFLSFGLYLGILYVANPSTRNQPYDIITEVDLSIKGEDTYQLLIEASDYYDNEPLIYVEEDQFSLLALNGYHTSFWFGRGPVADPKIIFALYAGTSTSSTRYQMVVVIDQIIQKTIDLESSKDSYYEIYFDNDETNFKLELRSKLDNSIVYETETISIFQDINDYPKQLVTGLQHTDNPTESFIINQLAFGIGLSFLYMMMYALRDKLFHGILDIHFFNYLLKEKKDR